MSHLIRDYTHNSEAKKKEKKKKEKSMQRDILTKKDMESFWRW